MHKKTSSIHRCKWYSIVSKVCDIVTYRPRRVPTGSDLDLLQVGRQALDWRVIETVKQALSESDLPFIVDVLDWHSRDESFNNQIGERLRIC